jgi:hypothetical protein
MIDKKKMPRLPNSSNRTAIMGPTGTGKTIAALWHLSLSNFDKMPWVIFDYKCDEHIEKLDAREVEVGFVPDKKDKGLFVVHPIPQVDDEAVDKMMWDLWARENVGIYIDEGLMVAKIDAINAILTQGRSKKIPVIILTQRPVWLPRFTFSEASFFQVFTYTDKRDEETIRRLIPSIDSTSNLDDYCSYYYDVGRRALYTFGPVPTEDKLVERINSRLEALRRKSKRFL